MRGGRTGMPLAPLIGSKISVSFVQYGHLKYAEMAFISSWG
jgi:hypothetical protein